MRCSALTIFEYLHTHPPRYGPEWGSGGIFGLKYYRNILYYTLAFEAESYFIDSSGIKLKYRFDKVGYEPVSGGDTYNAVEVVDDKVFFGGWVHAPAIYRGRGLCGAVIDFKNKYSHLHYYDISENKVELVWKESLHHSEEWVGEVSEIIYNPYHDELLIARADGYVNLGVYSINPWKKTVEQLANKPALKGTHYIEYACFAIHYFPKGFAGFECIDLIERKGFVKETSPVSIDGGVVLKPQVGPVSSIYGWLLSFTKGGIVLAELFDNEYYFIRLFDIPLGEYGPFRTNVVNAGGGLIVAYNSYTHGLIHTCSEQDRSIKKKLNTATAPTVILYITPPQVKVIATLGARVTSMELVRDKILIATNTMANTARYDASPFDQGVRGFIAISQDILTKPPTPLNIVIPGWMIDNYTFGGIPLNGYREATLRIKSCRENKLYIYEYFLTLPPAKLPVDEYNLTMGMNTIDLSNYSGIVSFRFEKPVNDCEMVIIDLK